MGRAIYRVVELFDPREPSIPRAVFACRVGAQPWEASWKHKHKLQSKLAEWFRELAAAQLEPAARTLLGSVALTQTSARAIAAFRVREICRMATGDCDTIPDFLCHAEVNHGGRGRGRAVVRIDADGTVTEWPSVMAAAEAIGVVPKGVWERLTGWSTDPGNPTWA